MAKCDLCGQTCKAIEMTQLLELYQVDSVICKDCEKWANKVKKVKNEILAETAPRVREDISLRIGNPPARRKWFSLWEQDSE